MVHTRTIKEHTYRKFRQKRKRPRVLKSNAKMIVRFENGSTNGAKPNPFHVQYKSKILHAYTPEKGIQRPLFRKRHQEITSDNRRQGQSNAGIYFPANFIFTILLVIIILFAGIILGYNFSPSQLTTYDGYGTSWNSNISVTNTDNNNITTSSNSSVVNTNNDADTITNTVSG